MKRRDFSAALVTAGAIGLPLAAQAQRIPREGTDYRRLGQRVPTAVPAGKIEVVEFFWYSCPHCNAFEPQLEAWSRTLPNDVVLRRVPVSFRADFVYQQRLFYTLEAMGKLGELHARVFHAIHVERQPTHRPENILEWAQKQGLDKARFSELFNSEAIAAQAQRATELQDAFGVEAVPALGIGGRYYTDSGMAVTPQRSLLLANYLIGEVRARR